MDWVILSVITLVASTIQSATGFGFGLLTVSTFLVIMNSVDAIQIVIMITLVMTASLWPKLRGQAPGNVLTTLVIGSAIGFPIGVAAFSMVDLETVKIVVAVIILAVAGQTAWQFKNGGENTTPKQFSSRSARAVEIGVGITSGALASALAIPGPTVMLYLARSPLNKSEIRATILMLFLFSYPGALAAQYFMIGINPDAWWTAAELCPAALIGVVAGHWLSKRISQRVFKAVILFMLIATGLFMLVGVLF